jgi:hypothetical protein
VVPKARNPLEPMTTVVSVLLGLMGVAVVAGVVLAIAGIGSLWGFGKLAVYVDAPFFPDLGSSYQGLSILQDGVEANASGTRFRVAHPDLEQRVWYTLTTLPGGVLFIGALLLVYRLLRGAERDGIYTAATAGRLQALGWFLLIGAAVGMVVEVVAATRLLATMVTYDVGWKGPFLWQVPWAVLLTAAGLLSFARIMRIGAEMRDELQATV